MKLCVLENVYGNKTLEESLTILTGLGVHTVEIGAGGYPGKAHCDPEILLHDEKKLQEFKDAFVRADLPIGALSAHGNAVHPDKAVAKAFHEDFENAVLLAEKLGVETVVTR